MKFLKYILEILFPVSCVSCGASINDEKNLFCAKCLTETVFTSYPSVLKNEMVDRLVSIGSLKAAYAPLYFKKDAPVKNVLLTVRWLILFIKSNMAIGPMLPKKWLNLQLKSL